jgi:hypothetical protein
MLGDAEGRSRLAIARRFAIAIGYGVCMLSLPTSARARRSCLIHGLLSSLRWATV